MLFCLSNESVKHICLWNCGCANAVLC